MKFAITLLAALLLTQGVSAQDVVPIEMDYTTVQRDCPKVSTAGLSTAVAVSSAALMMSPALIAGGTEWYDGAGSNSPGVIATGATLAALGVAGLVTSAIFLKRKVQKKRQYQGGQCDYAHDPIIPGVRF